MPILEIEEFERVARDDPELTREIRYFTGQIELTAGVKTYVIHITEGQLVRAFAGDADESAHLIALGGPEDLRNAMLEDKPMPFHHSLQSRAVKHGFKLSTATMRGTRLVVQSLLRLGVYGSRSTVERTRLG